MNRERLMKMAGAVRTGGKGSVRRKKKAVHKTTTTDDKKLQSTLKKIGVSSFPGIEEVCIFQDDTNTVIQFTNPKVQATVGGKTWVVSGIPQIKKTEDVQQPGIMDRLGADEFEKIRNLLMMQAFGAKANVGEKNEGDDDDDEVPELVPGETFEAAAEEGQAQQASS